MVRINIDRFPRVYIMLRHLTHSIIRSIKWFIKRLVSNWSEKHRSVKIIYRSENFLAVDKPYDMYINSNNPDRKVRIFLFETRLKYYCVNQTLHFQNTLQLELRKMLPDLVNLKLRHEFHFVHRLDYPTSGVMCIALNKKAARAASSAFENKKVQKFYVALVHGLIHESHIVINKSIGQQYNCTQYDNIKIGVGKEI